jgi:hypothetical protein
MPLKDHRICDTYHTIYCRVPQRAFLLHEARRFFPRRAPCWSTSPCYHSRRLRGDSTFLPRRARTLLLDESYQKSHRICKAGRLLVPQASIISQRSRPCLSAGMRRRSTKARASVGHYSRARPPDQRRTSWKVGFGRVASRLIRNAAASDAKRAAAFGGMPFRCAASRPAWNVSPAPMS